MTKQEAKYMQEIREEAQKVTRETITQEFKRYFLPFASLVGCLFLVSCSFFWYIQDSSTSAMNKIAESIDKLAESQNINAVSIAVNRTEIKNLQKHLK